MILYTKDGYFEAIFQIRPKNNKVLGYVKKQIDKANVSIAKELKFKYGFDLYLTSWRFAIALGRKLKRVFKGEVKITRKLYSVDRLTSKRLYRVTVCFRLKEDTKAL